MYTVAPPEIITHPTDTSAGAPFSAVFSCSVQTYGYLTITWYRNNVLLRNNKALDILLLSVNKATSVLTIPNVSSGDVGTYYCVAWANDRAVRSMTANLFLAGKIHFNIIVVILWILIVCIRSTFTASSGDNAFCSKSYY